jgi:hypothetical protein
VSRDAEAAASRFSPQAIHLVRTATQSNIMLSQMADQKASLLMGAAIVVFSLSIGQASRGAMSVSLLLLGGFAFLSACLAVAAVLPTFGAKPPPHAHRNLLFFGVFAHMEEDEFADAVIDRLENEEEMFRMMLRDIHQNGTVLQRKKYRLLGWSYRVFLAGLALSFGLFLYEKRESIAAII